MEEAEKEDDDGDHAEDEDEAKPKAKGKTAPAKPAAKPKAAPATKAKAPTKPAAKAAPAAPKPAASRMHHTTHTHDTRVAVMGKLTIRVCDDANNVAVLGGVKLAGTTPLRRVGLSKRAAISSLHNK